jgi:ubiquinone/menaquinone biosynthesis C-methylase UbiE
LDNVEFRLGEIEHLPVADNSVDVIISNCVINLSPDKPQVWREMARVLKPGGRIGIADVIAEDRLSPAARGERGSYSGCIAGALSRSEYEQGLVAAGFEQISVEFTHEVEDGMHSSIVKAARAEQARPVAKPLPLTGNRSKGTCCG